MCESAPNCIRLARRSKADFSSQSSMRSFASPEGRKQHSPGLQPASALGRLYPKRIDLKADGETSAFRSTRRSTSTRNNLSFRARARSVGLLKRKGNPISPVMILFHRSDGFRAISLCVSFPGLKPSAESLGCSVFALQAVETRTRTSPNCSGRIGECGPIPAGGTSSLP
jgi:hypothetical protein